MCCILYASPLPHIIGVEFEKQSTKITFNKSIQKDIYNFFQLKSNELKRDIYDFDAILSAGNQNYDFDTGVKIRIAQNTPQRVRIVLSHNEEIKTKIEIKGKIAHITIITPNALSSLFPTVKPSAPEKEAPKSNQIPKVAPKSSRIIVLDPGHGGKDCGALGHANVCEKVIVLNLAKELEKELKKRGYKVYMTRTEDIFIPLRQRTEFANAKGADIFISLHANAIAKEKHSVSSGIESYFLSPARSERAKNVAALENKEDIQEMNNFSRETVLGIINSQRLYASHRLALDIQFGMLSSVKKKHKTFDGGVREGPFWVLVGALMPSVLLEIGYITHPIEGKLIASNAYQKLLAIGIANGIDGYFVKNFN